MGDEMSSPLSRVKRRFQVQVGLAALSASLCVITLVSKDWIELVFRVDPDRGSGSLEWVIVALTATAALTCGALARSGWKCLQVSTE
jgi:hypothetical protein